MPAHAVAAGAAHGAGAALSAPAVGGIKGWQLVLGAGVAIALFLYIRSRGSASSGQVVLQPAASSGAPLDISSPPPINTPDTTPPNRQPIPFENGPTLPQPSTPDQPSVGGGILNIADTFTRQSLNALAQSLPAGSGPQAQAYLHNLYPLNGPNFPFSQSSQVDCGSGQTFVNSHTGCLNNDAYARAFGSGHQSQPVQVAHPVK